MSEEYSDIERDYLYSDATAQALVMGPSRSGVLVMEDFLGDLLSDLGRGTVGGIGVCGSGNRGDRLAHFEPVHGNAPTLSGQDRANPLAQVLSTAMLLGHLGESEAGEQIRRAVWRALETETLQIWADGCPVGGTRATAKAGVDQL